MLILLAEGSVVEHNYDKAIQLLTKAQELGPFIQVPELRTISLVRCLVHFQRIVDIPGRFLVGTSMASSRQFISKSVPPFLLPIACMKR
jgi:hypothetical protein